MNEILPIFWKSLWWSPIVIIGLVTSSICFGETSDDPFSRLTDQEPNIRAAAVAAVGRGNDPRAMAALKRALAVPEPVVQLAAAKVLGLKDDSTILDELIAGLESNDVQVREGHALALAHRSELRAFDALAAQCPRRNFAFRWQVGEAIGRAHNRRFVPKMLEALREDTDWRVQEVAVVALAEMYKTVGVDPLLQSLKSRDKYIRKIACWHLGRIGDPRAIDPLLDDIVKKYDTYELRIWGSIAIRMIGEQLGPVFTASLGDLNQKRLDDLEAFEQQWAKYKQRHLESE